MAETQSLEDFLAGLPEEDREQVQAAAARIEAVEREIAPPTVIEQQLPWLAVAALVLFVLGVGGLFGMLGWVRAVFGLTMSVLMVSAFPVLMLVYLWSVRGRTAADHEKMALNEKHFLPHGGLYFGAADGESGSGSRQVVRVDWKPGEKNLREQVQARYDAATKLRWWK
jgi:hypothetical protein